MLNEQGDTHTFIHETTSVRRSVVDCRNTHGIKIPNICPAVFAAVDRSMKRSSIGIDVDRDIFQHRPAGESEADTARPDHMVLQPKTESMTP